MFFAPTMHSGTFVPTPQSGDAALERFLLTAVLQARAQLALNVQDSEHATTLQLDVPGLAREQISIYLEDSQVRLQSVEGAPRLLKRGWELPHETNPVTSSAKLENGVLTLVLDKRVPVSKAVSLSIA